MFLHHLKFAVRVFLKDKFFSSLNILGLALGIGISIILLLILQNDLTYDQHYKNHNNICRLSCHYEITGVDELIGLAARELGPVLKEAVPELELITPIEPLGRSMVKYEGKQIKSFYEENIIHTDSTYFRMFSHQFISGDVNTCLNGMNNLVVTESTARKYFGDEPPLDKVILIDNASWKITAVIKDLPENTHLKFDFILSGLPNYREWSIDKRQPTSEKFWNPDVLLYLRVPENFNPQRLYDQWPGIYAQYYKPTGDKISGKYTPVLERLSDIHLYSEMQDGEPEGTLTYLYAFTGIGFFIVLLACINYMNLSTAKSTKRATEIAIKKIVGSGKRALIISFLTESVLLSIISLLLAIGLVFVLLNATSFNQLIGKNISFDLINNPLLLWGSLGIAVTLGLISGLYPAFYLPAIPAAVAMKGGFKNSKASHFLRRVLITVQFSISILVIVCTLFMRDQIDFVRKKDLGFNKNNLLVLPLLDTLARNSVPLFKNELLKNPNITAVTSANAVMGMGIGGGVMFAESETGMQEQGGVLALFVGDDYIKTMGLTLLSGRDFQAGRGVDENGVYVANEAAVKLMGWGKEPLGKKVTFWRGENPGKVIGVVKDFNVNSLHQGVDPMFIVKGHWQTGFVQIRLTGNNLSETIDYVKTRWLRLDASHPFEYFFLDQKFNEQYKDDILQTRLLSLLSGVCIFISLLGLVGLSAFAAAQRTKEIGVRKVMGAKTPDIIYLLSRDVLFLVILSTMLVAPLSYWIVGKWMSNYAYQTQLNYLLYLAVTLFAICFVFLTILFQSLKVARANPVDSLKYE